MDKFWSTYTCCVHMPIRMSLCMCVCVCVCVCVCASASMSAGGVCWLRQWLLQRRNERRKECVCVCVCMCTSTQAHKHTRVIFCSCLSKDSWEECSHSSINIDLSFTQMPSKPTKTALSSQTLNICAALLLAAGDAVYMKLSTSAWIQHTKHKIKSLVV